MYISFTFSITTRIYQSQRHHLVISFITEIHIFVIARDTLPIRTRGVDILSSSIAAMADHLLLGLSGIVSWLLGDVPMLVSDGSLPRRTIRFEPKRKSTRKIKFDKKNICLREHLLIHVHSSPY